MLFRLAAIALVLAACPASAAFRERHEHWTVTDASPPDCAAVNRPLEEFDAAPYAALSIRMRRGEGARLLVFAWPGAFKYGDKATITIGIGPGAELAAEALDTYVVAARDVLPEALIAEMRDARWVPFEITGLPQMLLFDLSQIDAVMKSLDACVRQLPG